MESLSGNLSVMMMQTGKHWIRDYRSLFLRDISFWYFLSNSLMWPLLIIVSDIFNQYIPDLCFIKENKPIKGLPNSVKNLEKQPIFLAVLFKMAGALEKKAIAS